MPMCYKILSRYALQCGVNDFKDHYFLFFLGSGSSLETDCSKSDSL